MKKRWVCMLVVLLFIFPAMTATIAETDDEIELVINDEELDLFSEPAYCDIPEEIEFSFGESELPLIEETGRILPDSSLDVMGPTTDPERSAAVSNAGMDDFVIVNGILVTYIGAGGDVVIPNSVTSIGESAFESCSSLTSVTIPNSVTSIGDYAFSDCSSLTGVTIPDSITDIGESVFSYCSSLTSVTIPDSVTSIGDYAFSACSSLTSVTIPDSVTSIGERAFGGCGSLISIDVESKNNHFSSINGVLFNKEQTIIITCPGGKQGKYVIPNSVTRIGSIAFEDCDRLTSVTIPNSVTVIEDWAFCNCSSLTSVTIGNSVTIIKDYAFSQCSSLTSVTIPNSVTTIKDWAFNGCSSLTSVTIPDSVTSIGDMAFSGCSSSLTIYGNTGSYAETYAKQQGFTFIVLIAKAKITVSDQVYTGNRLKPAVKVVLGKKTLNQGTDYTVSYKSNKNIGTATVTITGKGKYGASVNKTFKINPKPVALTSLTAGSKKLTVKWKKGKNITGYEVQYSLKSNFKSAKKVTISKASTVKTILKNLKANKTYYVRIRTYKTVKGKKYYSTWSKAKSAKPTK